MPLLTVMDVSSVVARVNLSQEQARNVKVGNTATLTPIDGSAAGGRHRHDRQPGGRSQQHDRAGLGAGRQSGRTPARRRVRPRDDRRRHDRGSDASFRRRPSCRPKRADRWSIVVDETNTANHAKVQVGVREGDQVQVLMELQPDATIEGVQPGERVVTVGGLGLEDGAKVRIVKPGEDAGDRSDEPRRRTKKAAEARRQLMAARRALDRALRQADYLRHPHPGRRGRLSRLDHSRVGLSRSGLPARAGRRRQRRRPDRPDAGHGDAADRRSAQHGPGSRARAIDDQPRLGGDQSVLLVEASTCSRRWRASTRRWRRVQGDAAADGQAHAPTG